MQLQTAFLLLFSLSACSPSSSNVPSDITRDAADIPETKAPPFSPPVHGWMLLDPDPIAVEEAITAAAAFGVNHVQLSHGLIDEIDQVLGDDPVTLQRVETLNFAIDLAHEHGMKAYAWAHEFTNDAMEVCFAPDDPFWEERAQTYRDAFARLPDLDGVILMFGSSSPPPWFSVCFCDWCLEHYDDLPLFIPPPGERLRMVVENIGSAIVADGRELYVRTFVHEPPEIGWHSEGLSTAAGVPFTGMHKGPVQDWQPYNPHHPCMGEIGDHPGIVELDVAGEYYGLSVLPWAAPGYYRFRLNHMWATGGVGAVLRVQRYGDHALGTLNEVNLVAVRRLIEDPHTSLDTIWEEFLAGRYGVAPGSPELKKLQGVLATTFPVRRKSHYVLGIWALAKSSDLPDGIQLDQFDDRGKMPKWDSDWQEVWDRLDQPDEEVVRWIWQEGTEAVVLAERALAQFSEIAATLDSSDAEDLERRLTHQALAARAWRAADLTIWGVRSASHPDGPFPPVEAWRAWAWEELVAVVKEMEEAGLGGVSPAGPASVQKLVDAFASAVPAAIPEHPDGLLFDPIIIEQVTATSATLRLRADGNAKVAVDYGLEIPDFGESVEVDLAAGEEQTVVLEGLTPNSRWVVRLRGSEEGRVVLGGDFWVFTAAQ